MENKKIATGVGAGILVIIAITAVLFVWLADKTQRTADNSVAVPISDSGKNRTGNSPQKPAVPAAAKANILRGTVVAIKDGKLIVKTADGNKEAALAKDSVVYQLNKQGKPEKTVLTKIVAGKKVNVKFDPATMAVTSVLVE